MSFPVARLRFTSRLDARSRSEKNDHQGLCVSTAIDLLKVRELEAGPPVNVLCGARGASSEARHSWARRGAQVHRSAPEQTLRSRSLFA